MSPEIIVLIGRVIERTAAWGLAGLLLFFAFKLSTMLTKQPPQTAEFKWKDFLVKLTRVSPGVFFAVLGTAIVVISLRSPLDISSRRTQPAQKSDSGVTTNDLQIRFGVGESAFSAVEMSVTINRLDQFAKMLEEKSQDAEAVREVQNAAKSMLEYRDSLLAMAFGKTQVSEFRKNASAFAKDPRSVSEKDRHTYEALYRAFFSTELPK